MGEGRDAREIGAPFELPLSLDQFRRAISLGFGRAWLHVARHGAAGLHGVLGHALLHCLAYDSQCEGDRAAWTMAIIDQAGAGATLYPEFIAHVHDAPIEEFPGTHISQRGSVLAALAKRGVAGASDALHRLFVESRTKHPNELLGAVHIIDVEGELGLRRVCSLLGNEAHEKASRTVDDWFLNVFDEDREVGAGLRILEAARDRDAGIDRYLTIREAVTQTPGSHCRASDATPIDDAHTMFPPSFRSLTAAQIIEWAHVASVKASAYPSVAEGWGWLSSWGRTASARAVAQVLRALEGADSALEQRRLLSVFARRTMPRVSDEIIRLAESEDEYVRRRLYSALGNVSDPRVRELALRSLASERITEGAVKLWISNYQPGDHHVIGAALFVPDDLGERHSLLSDLADLCGRVTLAECLPLMLFVYEHSPCGNCRSKVVDALAATGTMPEWMSEECRFDAMEEIREAFGGPKDPA